MRLTTVASIYVYKSPEKLSEKNIYDSSRAEQAGGKKIVEEEIHFFFSLSYPAQAVAAKNFSCSEKRNN